VPIGPGLHVRTRKGNVPNYWSAQMPSLKSILVTAVIAVAAVVAAKNIPVVRNYL